MFAKEPFWGFPVYRGLKFGPHSAVGNVSYARLRVASSIGAPSHTFVEIAHEIVSTAILLPSADSFKKG